MSSNFPQIALIYDRYKKASPERKASVEIRITFNRKQKYISTGIKLYPYQWKKNQAVNCPDCITINTALDNMVRDMRQIILDMSNNIDLSRISSMLERKRNPIPSFIEYCRQRAEIRKYGKAADSKERYDRFIRLFSEYGKIKLFEDITDRNIIIYDRYLDSQGMKPYSKWNNYHRFLNSFIMDAINDEYLRRNPYKWIKIEKDRSFGGIEKYLTEEELGKLENAEMSTLSLERVRDLFLFQTYTCMSYTDLRKFDFSKIVYVKDTPVYTGNREKTDKPYTIPIDKKALDILKKYNYKLPIISNVKYNLYLKYVAKEAKINKPVSTHWARHTGATLLLNRGIDMRIVSRICGHSSTKITEQIYAKLLDETVVDAIKNSHLHRQE